MRKLFFIFALLILAFPGLVSADKLAVDAGPQIYIFHLWHTDGKLTEDYDFNFPFDQAYEEYKEVPANENYYSGKIISVTDTILATFYFPPDAFAAGRPGKLSVKAPYFPNAKTVFFSDQSGKELLSIDLAPFGPLCNENGTCNDNFGENAKNCPSDCRSKDPNGSASVSLGNASEKVSSSPSPSLSRYLPIIIGSGIIVFPLLVWTILRYRKRRDSSAS